MFLFYYQFYAFSNLLIQTAKAAANKKSKKASEDGNNLE